MKRATSRLLLVTIAIAASLHARAATPNDPLAPFHEPAADERRFVISVPTEAEESTMQVELLIGRVLTVDCNERSYLGKLQRKRLLGRGLVYYTATDLQLPVVPLPPCPADTPARQVFVRLAGEPYLVAYDSKTLIVVYTPAAFEVRYRIWRANVSEPITAEAR